MEGVPKLRTPDSVNVMKWCKAKKHYVDVASDLQVISSADALRKLTGFKMYDSGHVYDFACLRVGDRICKDYRKAALLGPWFLSC